MDLPLSLCGIAVGALATLGPTRLLTHLVPSVRPGDSLTLSAVIVLLVAMALAASMLPARRASRIDPLLALRHE